MTYLESLKHMHPVERQRVLLGKWKIGEGEDTMEKLNTIQTRENLNEVHRVGEKGPGGAYHEYMVVAADGQHILEHIQFQKGPRKAEDSTPGVLDCDLLEIVRDRLTAFRNGEMTDLYTENALSHVESALFWLSRRVEDRILRGVLGTMEK